MNKFRNGILAVIRESLRSRRWEYPDCPGSANIMELSEHIANGEQYAQFRESETGRYYLAIIEPLERALNDDWLPFELFGLELAQARRFLVLVEEEIVRHGLEQAVPVLRAHYEKMRSFLRHKNKVVGDPVFAGKPPSILFGG